MYGPASSGPGAASSGGRGGPPRERTFTPRGQMSAGANQRPPLLDLPPHLRMMFEPPQPLEFKPPITKAECKPYTGVSQYATQFETTNPPPRDHFEPPVERKNRIKEQLRKLNKEKNELMLSDWNPNSNPKATGNAYNTLFVGRLSYDTNDKKLRREFEQYGNIKSLRIVTDLEGKSRGYAFIEFEREEDLTMAYKRADGKKIDSRRIVVDVERGRTVRDWRPRRFGGGLGGRKEQKSKKDLEEEAKKAGSGGLGGPPRIAAVERAAEGRGPDRGSDRERGPVGGSESRHDNGGGSRGEGSSRYGPNGGVGGSRHDTVPSVYGPPPTRVRERSNSRDRDRAGASGVRSAGNDRVRDRDSRDRGGDRVAEKDRARDRDREGDRDRGIPRGIELGGADRGAPSARGGPGLGYSVDPYSPPSAPSRTGNAPDTASNWGERGIVGGNERRRPRSPELDRRDRDSRDHGYGDRDPKRR